MPLDQTNWKQDTETKPDLSKPSLEGLSWLLRQQMPEDFQWGFLNYCEPTEKDEHSRVRFSNNLRSPRRYGAIKMIHDEAMKLAREFLDGICGPAGTPNLKVSATRKLELEPNGHDG